MSDYSVTWLPNSDRERIGAALEQCALTFEELGLDSEAVAYRNLATKLRAAANIGLQPTGAQ